MGSKLDLKPTVDKKLIKKVMCNDTLFRASMPDEDITLLEKGKWEPDSTCVHLVCKKGKDPIAIIRLYALANITVDMHVHLIPKYWGTGVSAEVQTEVEKYLKKNTNYCKVVIQTPQCCREVLKAVTREGYQLEGILTAAIHWRGEIENIILMSKFIRGNNHG